MLLSLVVGLNAQTDLYYTEGTEWEEEWFFENEETTMSDYRQFTVSGDTVVNGTTYKCVRCKVRVNDGATQDKLWDRSSPWHWEVIEGLPPILIREDGGKVYYYDGKKETLRYDFDWSVGKLIPLYYDTSKDEYVYYEIHEIESFEMLDGSTQDCVYRDLPTGDSSIMQVKSIGFLLDWYGLFYDYGSYAWREGKQYYHVMKFSRGGQLLYEVTKDDILSVRNMESHQAVEESFSIDGIKTGKTAKGLNIVRMKDGSVRKVIVR